MKRMFALLLCIILVLGLFVGCNKDAADSTTTAATEASTEPAEPAGKLYLSFGPTLEVVYDEAGNVLEITGINESGKTIAAESVDLLGRGCVFAARKFLRYASDNKLLGDAKDMVVRVGNGDPLPTEDFLGTIVTDCQYLADEECTGIQLMQLNEDDLGADGNILPATAKSLAARFLGVEEAQVTGDDNIVDGAYIYTNGDTSCAVDAFTGLVTKK